MIRYLLPMSVGLLPLLACNTHPVQVGAGRRDATAGSIGTPAEGGASGQWGGTGGVVTATGGSFAPDVLSDSQSGISDSLTSQPDAGPVVGVPKGFRFNNHTGQTVYVQADPPVACQQQGPSGLEACDFWGPCMIPCTDVAKLDGNCYLSCPLVLGLYVIPTGESHFVSWPGMLHQLVRGDCTIGFCGIEVPFPSGSYLGSIAVYVDYNCDSPPCVRDDSGYLGWASGRGASTTVTVPFSIPYASDEVVFEINPS